ncbi:hypothetical protein [Nocardia thailandica]|uniref:Uncharacterized protein n=1 Tax=Nocardia thailandica TaxID=257275 RepID=A0ABW6PKW9_9NOCA|nr:hypothetical protein [Nocardia thailandica]
MKPVAVGFIQSEVSGIRQHWDETQLRSLAARFGYDLAKTVVLKGRTGDAIDQLCSVVARLNAVCVFTPSTAHLGGRIPVELSRLAAVVTVDDRETYARGGTGAPEPSAAS